MLNNVISYILENPVKAKLVEKWDDFPGNYLRIESLYRPCNLRLQDTYMLHSKNA